MLHHSLNRKITPLCLLVLLMLLYGASNTRAAPSADCVIPPSGPWPTCATQGDTPPPHLDNNCVIPASGAWPDCARNSPSPPTPTTPTQPNGDCVIPPSGPWPTCATQGDTPPPVTPDCVIPPIGPWPECAKNSPTTPPPTVSTRLFVTPERVIAGQEIAVEWHFPDIAADARLTLFHRRDNGYYDDVSTYTVSRTGKQALPTETTDENSLAYRHTIWFELNGQKITESRHVQHDCTSEWFFLPAGDQLQDPNNRVDRPFWRSCPSRPLISQASQQYFEHGSMVWIAERDEILIIIGDTITDILVGVKTDNYQAGIDPVSDPSIIPPPGKWQPEHGFGKMWRENPQFREPLGWAIAPPVNYETVYQKPLTDFRNPHEFVRLSDGEVLAYGGYQGILSLDPNYPDRIDGHAHPNNGFRTGQTGQSGACVIPPSGPWPACARG